MPVTSVTARIYEIGICMGFLSRQCERLVQISEQACLQIFKSPISGAAMSIYDLKFPAKGVDVIGATSTPVPINQSLMCNQIRDI
jgi:hypothetical protein